MHRILVLEAGCLIEQGTHSDLIALGGKYFQMWPPNGANEIL